ncbi:MAG TPA: glycoside hydrolase family 88 protein [Verrucomicrobiae bacterium]|nr:glycoside hydrolase family 88 protein [Verrucomicrobiae bacterium]
MKLMRVLKCCCLLPAALALSLANAADFPSQFKGATPLEWSIRMAQSEMERRGDNLAWKEGGRAKWDYTAGLFTESLLTLHTLHPDPRYVEFSKRTIGSFVKPDGGIQGYKLEDYNIDNINPGKTVITLWERTQEERYRKCAELLRNQLKTHPRTSDGGFWHKQRYPNQMWLDGLFMGAPFYAEYAKLFNEPAAFDDVAKQFRLIVKHTYDSKSGLFYHGWDESREQDWASKTTGTSSNFWGRGLGWFSMALVDVLDFLPQEHPGRADILKSLKLVADGIVRHQDPASGLWWQVMDQGGREGNYLEATAATMFTYTLAKAINEGYLPRDPYLQPLLKGYSGLIERLLKVEANGKVSLTQCCSVAGLGYGRDGSYAYYLREPIVNNDLKGVGPLILGGIQMQRLLGLPMRAEWKGLGSGGAAASILTNEWKLADEILARIQAPVFPNREFSIVGFGAKSDGQSDSSDAIRNAIDACVKAGGGRVVVPAGMYLTGPIELKSRVNLHLDGGATLLFKKDPAAFLPAVLSRYEGMDCWNYSPLIYAIDQENIAVTGDGVLDGQADHETWWPWKGQAKHGWKTGGPQQKAARDRLIKMVENNVPVDERRFGEGDYLRPSFIHPYRCRNVLIEGVRIRRSPMWEIHPALCTNVIVRGVDIVTHGPNNDGCNPEASRDVLIEDCLFDTGDDCIAIKSGRNNDGRRVGLASENIIIRNCTMKDGHGGVVIGSEISGGCRNVFVENCEMDSPNLDRVLRFKSNAVRGGLVENIFMRNIRVGRVADAILQIDFVYEEGAKGSHRPVVRNVVMENITSRETPRVLNVVGIPNGEISNVRVVNSAFGNVQRPDVIREATDVKLVDCVVENAGAAAAKAD